MNLYLQQLKYQFFKETGLYAETYQKEFEDWISLLSIRASKYFNFLCSLKVDIDDRETAEVGKGKYDSIAGSNTIIISPYAESMNKTNSCIYVGGQEVQIFSGNRIISGKSIDRYVTQNPYTYQNVIDFCKMFNLGYDICFGVYGDIYNNEKQEKMNLLKQFCDWINTEYDYEEATDGNNYFAVVKSKKRVR